MSARTIYEQAQDEYKQTLEKKMTKEDLRKMLLTKANELFDIKLVGEHILKRAAMLKKSACYCIESGDTEEIAMMIPYHLQEGFQSTVSILTQIVELWVEENRKILGPITWNVCAQGFSNTIIVEFCF